MIPYIDESVPVRLVKALAAHGTRALRFPNDWKGLRNGELLSRLGAMGQSCLITCDKNLPHQQTIREGGVALIVLPRQRFDDLLPYVPAIARAIAQARPGQVLVVEVDGAITTGS